jgi:Transposase IS66 family
VTQPLLREQLREWGIEISSGQLNALLQEGKERFHAEKDGLLSTGLALSAYVTVDDTGTRHQGKNGYVTHIGNEHFAWFKSTCSKSRINFLELLGAGHGYQINEDALAYMKKQGLSQVFLQALREHDRASFADQRAWQLHLDSLGMDVARYRNIATEGALLGSLKRRGVAQDLAIISDDAGQFNVLIHGLCWVHAERLVHKLLPLNDQHREDIARVRSDIWSLYAELKDYKRHPTLNRKRELQKRFDAVFSQKTRYATLNRLLRRIRLNKSELLLVLERPEVPLHTNDSERDIRDHVKKQKISGGTRSELGRQCRDTFSSLKKTCRKLGISFWNYLTDRISCSDHIPPLPHLVEQRLVHAA